MYSKTAKFIQEKYQLLETKEMIRQQLIEQFFLNYSVEEIATVNEKFETLVTLSKEVTVQCENVFEQTKLDILKIKQVGKIKKAYK